MAENSEQQTDRYAQQSFGMRGMKRWQLWGVTVVAVIAIAAALGYVFT